MKTKLSMCLMATALAFTSVSAFAQDVPSDTIRGKKPKDSVYHNKPAVTPRDTVHKAPPAKPNRPQPGTKSNTGVKPKSGEPNQNPPK